MLDSHSSYPPAQLHLPKPEHPSLPLRIPSSSSRFANVKEHPDITLEQCAQNLGIGLSTLSRWRKQYADNGGTVPTRGSGNYSSDETKEIARLKRKLRDAEDALDVQK